MSLAVPSTQHLVIGESEDISLLSIFGLPQKSSGTALMFLQARKASRGDLFWDFLGDVSPLTALLCLLQAGEASRGELFWDFPGDINPLNWSNIGHTTIDELTPKKTLYD